MAKNISKYYKIFTVTLSNRFAYGGELLIRTAFLVIIMFIFSHLWKAVYESGANNIEGFTYKDIIWYLIITETLIISKGRPENKIDEEVKSGNIAYMLNKPYNYIVFQLSMCLGETLPQFLLNLSIGSMVVYFMVGGINISPLTILPIIFIILLANIMEFLIKISIGLSAFWVEDINMAALIYQKIIFVLGGMLIPFEFFPPLFKKIALAMPFGYMVYYPAKLVVKFDWTTCGEIIKGQMIWLLIFSIITGLIYSFGSRRLNINGG